MFVRTAAILMQQQLHATNPAGLFTGLLKLVIDDEAIIGNPALSVSGTRDTVAIPSKILAAVNSKHLDFDYFYP